ncbi:hypothetical protein SAMN04488058_101298 [Deinococcus reticulitermitis]|uniref:Uncharacterized protein n=1 Tax=Deinococcus reticulitermitis TaxID=856736 RepID=A0A1H6ST10_9DEIO|nr:hypothetical protein [Deinococcus reticulitermitis]SEI67065.1 hypothetical protein SAMN04488058_101298 [Deinococcus reticulitermitis]
MPLGTAERLEAEYALTAAALGLSATAFEGRIELWETLAGERAGATDDQRRAQVASFALTAWIAYLIEQDDKFRAEGDLTTERDVLGRIALLREQQRAAQQAAGLVAPLGTANPAPLLEPWGLG